jgi:nitric oxide dioxygenase
MLSQEDINIIKATVPAVGEYGWTVTNAFYQNLLHDAPQLNNVFNQANQATGHQARALANAVYAYAQNIEHPEVLASALENINHKHVSLFVQPEQYDIVGKYLLDAFGQILGDAFTPNVRNAWAAAYGQLAKMMIATEKTLYQRADDWTDWKDFVIKDKTPESSEITSFTFACGDRLPTYLPGQYISIRVFVPSFGFSQPRQYSLSDAYYPDHYRISVKKETGNEAKCPVHPGMVSNTLHNMEVGTKVQLSRPYGTFHLESQDEATQDKSSPLVLISAGVGLTPLMAILNNSVASGVETPISWIHGFRKKEAEAFTQHINKTARVQSNIKVLRFCSQPQARDRPGIDFDGVGRVDLDSDVCDDNVHLFLGDDSTKYFVCGPPSFMSSIQKQLEARGIPPARISMERFGTGGIQAAN